VLLSRPDILVAEHRLKAANATSGGPRRLLPRISLTAAVGTMSGELSGLFASGRGAGPSSADRRAAVHGGYNKANLDAANVDRAITVAQYEKAIQGLRGGDERPHPADDPGRPARGAAGLVEALSEAYVSPTPATSRDRQLPRRARRAAVAVRGQQALINVRFAEQANLVTLYKCSGGA